MVSKPLLRPFFWGVRLGGVRLKSRMIPNKHLRHRSKVGGKYISNVSEKKTWETRFNPSFLFIPPSISPSPSPALSLGQKPPCIFHPLDLQVSATAVLRVVFSTTAVPSLPRFTNCDKEPKTTWELAELGESWLLQADNSGWCKNQQLKQLGDFEMNIGILVGFILKISGATIRYNSY